MHACQFSICYHPEWGCMCTPCPPFPPFTALHAALKLEKKSELHVQRNIPLTHECIYALFEFLEYSNYSNKVHAVYYDNFKLTFHSNT